MIKSKIKKHWGKANISKPLFIASVTLLVFGCINFLSASLGILSRNEVKFFNMIETQTIGYIIGIVALIAAIYIPYKLYYKYALAIFAFGVILSLLVFVPGLGFSHGGGTRWLNIFGFSLQPGEILKLCAVIMTSWFVYKYQDKLSNFYISTLGFGAIIGVCAAVLVLQKDLGTLVILGAGCGAVYFINGAKIKHLLLLGAAGLILVFAYAYHNPYIMSRLNVFNDSNKDQLGSAYQTKQALIGVATGGLAGRGIGQSIQKFSYLPEPVGDSIFAVQAEEFGLIGSSLTIFLFAFIIIYSILRSQNTSNIFAKGLIIGIATLFFAQTVLNIASMLGLIPLSGDILPFYSQGGTAIIVHMFLLGLLLQLTRNRI